MVENKVQEVTDLYNKLLKYHFIVENIFTDYYGADNVELQVVKLESVLRACNDYADIRDVFNSVGSNSHILVKFPEVTITNENGASVDVKELWVKVPLLLTLINGVPNCLLENTFKISRSHFPMSHVLSDYMHSHCQGVPFINGNSSFISCCLGSGPIRRTISSLCAEYNEDLWNLFCFELDSYVHTESLSGVPWRYITNISSHSLSVDSRYDNYYTVLNLTFGITVNNMIKDFIPYFVKSTKFPFNFSNGSYSLAMSPFDFTLLVSNKFIQWYNLDVNPYKAQYSVNYLKEQGVITEVVIINNKVNIPRSNSSVSIESAERLRGRNLFIFKGQPVDITIEDDDIDTTTITHVLNINIIDFISTFLVQAFNYSYGSSKDKRGHELSFSPQFRFI